ncbi:FxsA family protein [Magnetospirillum sp. 64-120]|uniref:FxsA family protein n=1 Tax=Magnetospirillum sp. 64-120 TaxID=1895778 RepID=UPI0025BEED2A|nr:FxsA family protein [Magnetospirillum sp. 64-120]
MAWLLITLVIAIPVVEIAVFIKVAQGIGVVAAVLVAIGAGLIGLIMVRTQGLRTLMVAKSMADRGQLPIAEMFDGMCIALAGCLLILPGFLSDLLAIALLLPPVRTVLKAWLARHVTVVGATTSGPSHRHGAEVIDGEYTVVEPTDRQIGPN